MAYIYAPNHTIKDYMNHVLAHVGHTLRADFTNGHSYHKMQVFMLEAVGEASNQVYLSNKFGSWWFAVSELWAYGTPQCLTCGG